jgi:hypothetical protein
MNGRVKKHAFPGKFDLFEKTLTVRSIDAQSTDKEVVLDRMTVIAVAAPVMPP